MHLCVVNYQGDFSLKLVLNHHMCRSFCCISQNTVNKIHKCAIHIHEVLETTRTTLRLLLSHHVISFATSLNVNILHVRKLIDISFLCPSDYIYNNLFFLENPSCVKITHATYIVLKLLSFQYQSEILNIHIKLAAFLAMSTIHVFLTSQFLLEHK